MRKQPNRITVNTNKRNTEEINERHTEEIRKRPTEELRKRSTEEVRKKPTEEVRKRSIEEVRRPTEETETQQSEAVKRQKFDKNEKFLEKILRQNTALLVKIDKVIFNQEEIKERLFNLEEKSDCNNYNDDKLINTEFVKKIGKEIGKRLLTTCIYPSQDEMYDATVSYIQEEHPNFFNQFKRGVDGTRWRIYYEKNIASILLAKHRSYRGALVSKIREAMFIIFREDGLPPINTNVKTSNVLLWKSKPIVKYCFKKLFKKIGSEGPETYMSTIIRNLWRSKTKAPKVQIAFAISICEFILNPENPSITISEEVIKPILEKNLRRVTRRENFLCEDYESSGSSDNKKDDEYEGGRNEGGYDESRKDESNESESNEGGRDKSNEGGRDKSNEGGGDESNEGGVDESNANSKDKYNEDEYYEGSRDVVDLYTDSDDNDPES